MDLSRTEIRAWLREIMVKTGDNPTSLARRAGIAQSTVTRFLHSDDAPMLGLRSIAKIAHAAQVQPVGLPSPAPVSAAVVPRGMAETEAVPYEREANDSAIEALIGGRSGVDPWMLKTHSLEHAGYLPGDILIVNLSGQAHPGQVVCAQEYRWSEGRAETVFRLYEPPYLVASSSDPAVRKPLLVDNDRVIIKGVVEAMLRRSA